MRISNFRLPPSWSDLSSQHRSEEPYGAAPRRKRAVFARHLAQLKALRGSLACPLIRRLTCGVRTTLSLP